MISLETLMADLIDSGVLRTTIIGMIQRARRESGDCRQETGDRRLEIGCPLTRSPAHPLTRSPAHHRLHQPF
jgi:hypothetical protein